jgi:hypothetical protein
MLNFPKVNLPQDAFFRFWEGHHSRFWNRPHVQAIKRPLNGYKAEVFHG